MKRFALTSGAATAAAALVLGISAAPATAADVRVEGNAQVRVALENKVEKRIDQLDKALARAERSAALKGLDAGVRAEVRANINADQRVLADLAVEVNTAATLQDLRDIRDEVTAYRAAVYAEVIATLKKAERLSEAAVEARLTIRLTLDLRTLLGLWDNELDAAVEAAVELDATASDRQVAAVKAQVNAVAKGLAKATD